jgi:concanavalin A-like lectin/glucanase superfamily protein
MKGHVLAALTGLAAAAALAATPALNAAAAPGRPASVAGPGKPAANAAAPPLISSTVAPSWQTNDTVQALATAGGTVYVGGDFTSVRPPGDPAGTGETARAHLAAFSTSSGDLLAFSPALDGSVAALAVSPDGGTLYVGGDFTHADGQARDHLAAFDTATGTLLPGWTPSANATVMSIAPSPSGSAIYVGGNFSQLDGTARTFAGAVDGSGSLLPYAPSLSGAVTTLAVAPDGSRVLAGGYFGTVNGVAQNAIASTSPSTGASEPWASTILPRDSTCSSAVKDIVVRGTTAYIAAEGTGGGCFDGDFAATIDNGNLLWQSDCLGATQAIAVLGGRLYKGSHAHDCLHAPGGFPQVANGSGSVLHHLLTQSLTDGSLGHWTPNTDNLDLGPRAMATDGSQLFVGGGFTTVNGAPQQGFARFPAGPDTTAPGKPAAPVADSTSSGVDSVTFTAVSDRDNGTLTYSVYRDGGSTPIGTVTATSWPWALPVLHFRDAGLTPGSTHTYQVSASDGTNTTAKSAASAPVTVSSASPPLSYPQTVLASGPSFYWRLDETSGATAADSSPHGFSGMYEPGTATGAAGAITGSPDTAAQFDGKTGLVTAAQQVTGPQQFTIELWFKTTTNTGGKLIGFGSSQTGPSANYDRHLYMMNDGQLIFGVFSGQKQTIETPSTYNDGQWHYLVATLSSADGMALYVDGRLAGTNTSATSAQQGTGYWRVGGDNLDGWSLDPEPNSQPLTAPNSYYFAGTIDEVAVYPQALTAGQIAAHYAANALSH